MTPYKSSHWKQAKKLGHTGTKLGMRLREMVPSNVGYGERKKSCEMKCRMQVSDASIGCKYRMQDDPVYVRG